MSLQLLGQHSRYRHQRMESRAAPGHVFMMPSDNSSEEHHNATTVSILVVDSKPYVANSIHDLLYQQTQGNHRINWCRSIREALTEPRNTPIDLIFLNYDLSCTEHKNYLGLARRNSFPIPIVLVGDTLSVDKEGNLISAGASGYLSVNRINIYNLLRAIEYAKKLKEKDCLINELVNFDELTGTPTRQQFYQKLMQRIDIAATTRQQVGLMLVNLDGFKKVNNSLGHRIGDQTIKEVVERFQQVLNPGQQLSRISEDQFTIHMMDKDVRPQLDALIDRIRQTHRLPYQQSEHRIILGCSMGCALFPDSGRDIDELLRHAGTAMHKAKKERGCTFRYYSKGLDTDLANQIALEPELLAALRSQQFELYYQPRIDLRSQRIIGAEALIRWNHPTRGMLYPGEFIPLAEKTGLIVPMGYWVFYRACRDLVKMQAQRLNIKKIGINLSFRQFQDETLLPTIQRLIKHTKVDPQHLEFELTETAVALNELHVSHCIKELSKMGLAFSLDDFGTGYSSFAHLQKLPISTLKIDRSFIRGVSDNPDDAEIVRAIINLAHNLRKDVIAEGAEAAEHISFLRENQCDQVQGYYYSPPLCFNDFCNMAHADRQVQVVNG